MTFAPYLLDIQNDDAQTPIHLATLKGQSEIVRRLLIAGAEVNRTNEIVASLWHLANASSPWNDSRLNFFRRLFIVLSHRHRLEIMTETQPYIWHVNLATCL